MLHPKTGNMLLSYRYIYIYLPMQIGTKSPINLQHHRPRIISYSGACICYTFLILMFLCINVANKISLLNERVEYLHISYPHLYLTSFSIALDAGARSVMTNARQPVILWWWHASWWWYMLIWFDDFVTIPHKGKERGDAVYFQSLCSR